MYGLHVSTILCGDSLGAIGSRNQAFCLKGGAHRKSNRFPLFVSFQKISVASSGPIVASLHRAHGATASSSLFFGRHVYYIYTE